MKDRLRLDVADGKYTIVQPEEGLPYALRYGEPWMTPFREGSNMVLTMAYELEELRNGQRYVVGSAVRSDSDSGVREPAVVGAVRRVLLPDGCFIDPRGITNIWIEEDQGTFQVRADYGKPGPIVFESPCRVTAEDVARQIDAGSPLS